MKLNHNYSLEQDLTKNQLKPIRLLNKAHNNSIECLAVALGGTIVGTGSHDRTIKIWDVESMKEKMTLADHKEGVWSLDYCTDGTLLVSGSPDRTILVWDSKKGSPGVRLLAHRGTVYSARFGSNPKEIISCGQFGEIFFWDLAKPNTPVAAIKHPSNIVYDAIAATNGTVFCAGEGCRVAAIDAKDKKITTEDRFGADDLAHSQICAVKITGNECRVYVSDQQGNIVWYEWTERRLNKIAAFQAHYDRCRKVVFDSNSQQMLSSSRDGSIRVWDCTDLQHDPVIKANLAYHSQNVTSLAYLPNRKAISGSWDSCLALWDLSLI